VSRRRRGGPSLKIIKWRDIPAQVNGTAGEQKVQVELPPRFQKAIDRAAMVAGKKDANSYIAEMGSDSISAEESTDIEAAVATLVEQLETKFTAEVLNEFVRTGGFDPESPADTPTVDPQPFPDQDMS
jgi:hypothetical protein